MDLLEVLKSASPAVYHKPEQYVETGDPFASLNLQEWSDEYEWERDPLAGVVDYLTDPRKTVEQKRGDCEDYAFVVASTLLEQGVSPVEIWWMWKIEDRVPVGHTVAAAQGRTYSSGRIIETPPEVYVENHDYELTRHKRLDPEQVESNA